MRNSRFLPAAILGLFLMAAQAFAFVGPTSKLYLMNYGEFRAGKNRELRISCSDENFAGEGFRQAPADGNLIAENAVQSQGLIAKGGMLRAEVRGRR